MKSCEDMVREREQNMLFRCIRTLSDYNIINVNETLRLQNAVKEMIK